MDHAAKQQCMPATSAPASRTVGFPTNVTKSEVKTRLPKQDEENNNDNWARLEVMDASLITQYVLKQGFDGFTVLVEQSDSTGRQNFLE